MAMSSFCHTTLAHQSRCFFSVLSWMQPSRDSDYLNASFFLGGNVTQLSSQEARSLESSCARCLMLRLLWNLRLFGKVVIGILCMRPRELSGSSMVTQQDGDRAEIRIPSLAFPSAALPTLSCSQLTASTIVYILSLLIQFARCLLKTYRKPILLRGSGRHNPAVEKANTFHIKS